VTSTVLDEESPGLDLPSTVLDEEPPRLDVPSTVVDAESPGLDPPSTVLDEEPPRRHLPVDRRGTPFDVARDIGHDGLVRKMSLAEASAHLSELVEQAEHQGSRTLILRDGKPAAAIVPVRVAMPRGRRGRALSDDDVRRSVLAFVDEPPPDRAGRPFRNTPETAAGVGFRAD
jgi:prevent-host-death family protein